MGGVEKLYFTDCRHGSNLTGVHFFIAEVLFRIDYQLSVSVTCWTIIVRALSSRNEIPERQNERDDASSVHAKKNICLPWTNVCL